MRRTPQLPLNVQVGLAVGSVLALLAGGGRPVLAQTRTADIEAGGNVELAAALDFDDCPGCRAYRDACQQPRNVGAPNSCGPIPTPAEGSEPYGATPLEASQGESAASEIPAPSMMAAAGASAVSTSSTPNMIGDLFDAIGGSSTITRDRLFVIASDIDAMGMTPDASPFAAAVSQSSVSVAQGFMFSNGGMSGIVIPVGVVRVQASPAEFTTAVSTGLMRTALTNNGNAKIPIVNDAVYQGFADAEFVVRNGSAGQTQFNADASQSFTHLQSGQLPMGGPGAGEAYDAVYSYDYVVVLPFDSLGGMPGANVGRQKMAENDSPIPRDRLIDSFSFFHNTPLAPGQDVTRNVVGFEKTFFDELTSIELRVPFASTLDSNLGFGPSGVVGGTNAEFGNMTLYGKLLLAEEGGLAVGAGLGVTLPTADDFVIRDAQGTEALKAVNQSPHLLPYFGFAWAVNSRLFWQCFLQLDVDTSGNEVYVSPFVNGAYTGQLQFADRLRDKDLLYADMSAGYWAYRAGERTHWVTGIAPILEVHYNGSLDHADGLTADNFRSVASSSFNLVNGVAGAVIQFGRSTNLTLAYATPMGGDKQFDGEFRLNLNWYFGSSASGGGHDPF